MGEDAKKALTPKLRFPEFRDADGWQEKSIEALARVSQGGTPDTSNMEYWGGMINWLTPAEMNKDDSPYIASTKRTLTEAGLANCSSELLPSCSVIISTRAPIGHLAINTTPMAINQGCRGLVPVENAYFLYSALLHAKARLIDLGAGNTFKELSGSALKRFVIPAPPPAEQQKIADCLTSLDELIAAQGRKVEALKAHKKGLMQQLFPREGETVPRLRFPEFRDAPAWTTATIGDIFETTSGGTPDRTKRAYWNGSIPWITTSLIDFNVITSAEEFITDEGLRNSSAKILPRKSVLIALIGQGKTRGKVALLDFEASTNQNCGAILPNDAVAPNFTFLNLCGRYEEIRGLSNGPGQGSLSQGLIRTLPFCFPKDKAEQQRIADCLSALDAQIIAESRKLDALKLHKRGLMQQLFPAAEQG